MRKHWSDLTTREYEILVLVRKGLENKEIGKELFIGEQTVKFHITHLLQKIGAKNRLQAVIKAIDQGILPCNCNSYERLEEIKEILDEHRPST